MWSVDTISLLTTRLNPPSPWMGRWTKYGDGRKMRSFGSPDYQPGPKDFFLLTRGREFHWLQIGLKNSIPFLPTPNIVQQTPSTPPVETYSLGDCGDAYLFLLP